MDLFIFECIDSIFTKECETSQFVSNICRDLKKSSQILENDVNIRIFNFGLFFKNFKKFLSDDLKKNDSLLLDKLVEFDNLIQFDLETHDPDLVSVFKINIKNH